MQRGVRLARAASAIALAFGVLLALQQWMLVSSVGGPGENTRDWGFQFDTPLPPGVAPFELQVVGARRVFGATVMIGATIAAAGLVVWDAKRWMGD